MPKRNAERKAARELQRAEGIGYQEALNRVRAESATAAEEASAAVAYVLQPSKTETELGITAEELGVRALPDTATPEQRAHAEAVWRPADPEERCRCSGTACHHGEQCAEEGFLDEETDDLDARCTGRLVHIDRHPGSMFGLTDWYDIYRCAGCGEGFETTVSLPEIPWGEVRDRAQVEDGERCTGTVGAERVTVIYRGIRHPNFPDRDPDEEPAPRHPDGDGTCRACSGYAFEGLLCDGCRREGWTDHYGDVQPPDPDAVEDYLDDEDQEDELAAGSASAGGAR